MAALAVLALDASLSDGTAGVCAKLERRVHRPGDAGGRWALLASSAQDHNENVHAFVMVGFHTSMRHSDILAIRRGEIDVGRKVIWIPQAKAGAREQPITGEFCAYLQNRMKMLPPGCEWLFPSSASEKRPTHTIRKEFRRSVARAGMDPNEITPHTLRHAAVTHLVHAGVDLPTVQRISGHKKLAMVARYAHQNGAHIQSAMDRPQGRVGETNVGSATLRAGKLH